MCCTDRLSPDTGFFPFLVAAIFCWTGFFVSVAVLAWALNSILGVL